MHEFLYELREHSSGLNCGRWDYLFSAMKTLRADPSRLFPDRATLTMEQPFMRAYTQLVVRTCHARGAHAMGGMAAQIPIKNDAAADAAVMARVRADKEREVRFGWRLGFGGLSAAFSGFPLRQRREILHSRLALTQATQTPTCPRPPTTHPPTFRLPRSATATTGPGSRTRGSSRSRARPSTRAWPGPTSSTCSARTSS